MKSIFIIMIISTLLFLTACDDISYDGMYCKTNNDKIIVLEHNIGDTYFIREVDIIKMKKLNTFIESKETSND